MGAVFTQPSIELAFNESTSPLLLQSIKQSENRLKVLSEFTHLPHWNMSGLEFPLDFAPVCYVEK